MNDIELQKIANRVLARANVNNDQNYGSVLAILTIISIMLTCVRILQECNKTKIRSLPTAKDKYALYESEIKSYTMKRGWFTKMRIKKVLRNALSKDNYEHYGFNLLNAILDVGETLTEEEIKILVEAANV